MQDYIYIYIYLEGRGGSLYSSLLERWFTAFPTFHGSIDSWIRRCLHAHKQPWSCMRLNRSEKLAKRYDKSKTTDLKKATVVATIWALIMEGQRRRRRRRPQSMVLSAGSHRDGIPEESLIGELKLLLLLLLCRQSNRPVLLERSLWRSTILLEIEAVQEGVRRREGGRNERVDDDAVAVVFQKSVAHRVPQWIDTVGGARKGWAIHVDIDAGDRHHHIFLGQAVEIVLRSRSAAIYMNRIQSTEAHRNLIN